MHKPYTRRFETLTIAAALCMALTACTKANTDSETQPAQAEPTVVTPQPTDPGAGRPAKRTADPEPPNIEPQPAEPQLACTPFTWHEGSKPKEIAGNGGGMSRGRGVPATARADMLDAEGGALDAPSVAKKSRSAPRSAAGSSAKGSAGPVATAESRPRPGGPMTDRRSPARDPGQLTAGQWRDLDHWAFYKSLFRKTQEHEGWRAMEKQWGFGLRQRVSVTVTAKNQPAPNVSVYLEDKDGNNAWLARTDNKGIAHLYPHWHEGPYRVCAAVTDAAGQRQQLELNKGTAELSIALDTAAPPKAEGLDIMFMVDTTGSMGDELSYLQAELKNVISRVQDKNQGAQIRTSVNFYRDTTDEYVVRPFAFTTSIKKSREQISAQSAGGGGDFPEAVDQALHSAIYQHKWSETARARILFLVLDAPPHQDKQILSKVRQAARRAAKQGIRIVPVAGSGIDKPTEFLMRFLAISTGGTYVFLSDDSGIGNSHLKPTVGKHDIKKLNALLVEVINRYAE